MYEELVERCKALRDYNGIVPDSMIQEAFDCVIEAADAIEELSREVKSLEKILGTHPDPKGEPGEPGVPPKEET